MWRVFGIMNERNGYDRCLECDYTTKETEEEITKC